MSVNITVSNGNKPLTQWKQVKLLLKALAIRGGIVVGALWFPGSKIYANYILLLHWWFWGIAAMMFLAVLFAGYSLSNQVPSLTPEHKNFGFIQSSKRLYGSWSMRVVTLFLEIPCLLFVGIYMGDWSLLIPMLLADVLCHIFVATVAGLWDKLPKEMTQDEVKIKDIVDASKDPITKALEDMKLKKSQEEKVADSIVDGMLNDK